MATKGTTLRMMIPSKTKRRGFSGLIHSEASSTKEKIN